MLLKPVICACVPCHRHTFCSVVLVFSRQLGRHHRAGRSCTEETWWWLLWNYQGKSQMLVLSVYTAALHIGNMLHALVCVQGFLTKTDGQADFLSDRRCEHRLLWWNMSACFCDGTGRHVSVKATHSDVLLLIKNNSSLISCNCEDVLCMFVRWVKNKL